jgi:hypothetical protein
MNTLFSFFKKFFPNKNQYISIGLLEYQCETHNIKDNTILRESFSLSDLDTHEEEN